MREGYNLGNTKTGRSNVLPKLHKQTKVRITISLDQDVVEYFKNAAEQPGALPYQTQINQTLRKVMGSVKCEEVEVLEVIKAKLLEDFDFLSKLVDHVKAD